MNFIDGFLTKKNLFRVYSNIHLSYLKTYNFAKKKNYNAEKINSFIKR